MNLRLGSSLSEMGRIYPWLCEAGRELSIPGDTLDQVNLCLEEIVSNILKYGYSSTGAGHHPIDISLHWENKRVVVIVEDNASPFNPLKAESKPHPQSLEEADVGGLGIDLVRSFSESMHYERLHDRNHLRVVMPSAD